MSGPKRIGEDGVQLWSATTCMLRVLDYIVPWLENIVGISSINTSNARIRTGRSQTDRTGLLLDDWIKILHSK